MDRVSAAQSHKESMNDLQQTLDEYRTLYPQLSVEDQVEITALGQLIPKCHVCNKRVIAFNEYYCSQACQDKLYPPHTIKGVKKLTIGEMQDKLRKMGQEERKRAHVRK